MFSLGNYIATICKMSNKTEIYCSFQNVIGVVEGECTEAQLDRLRNMYDTDKDGKVTHFITFINLVLF